MPVTLASGQTVTDLVVDATGVYWVNICGYSGWSGPAAIVKMPLGGGSVTSLVAENDAPESLVLDAAHLSFATSNAVLAMPSGGGVPTTIVTSGPPNPPNYQYSPASGLAVDTNDAYWLNATALYRVSLGGGMLTSLAATPASQNAFGVRVDASNVYWVSEGNVMACAKSGCGGTPTTLVGGGTATAMAIDSASVYWVDANGGTIMKAPLTGGAATTLASGQGSPLVIAVDSTSVYWGSYCHSGSQVDGAVVKLTPK